MTPDFPTGARGAGATGATGTAAAAGIDAILDKGLLAGLSPAALAETFGTPFYVYDLDLIGRRVAALKAVLPHGFRVAFAVKANPSLAVLSYLRGCGLGADVASAGELEAVLRAGFDPATVAMTGPGKRDTELAAAVAAGIGLITVESPGELRRLEAIAAAAGRRQPILLRLAVSEDARLETVRIIGGVEGKFGMPLHTLIEAAASQPVRSTWSCWACMPSARRICAIPRSWRTTSGNSWRSAGKWPPKRARNCAWWTRAAAWAFPIPAATGRSICRASGGAWPSCEPDGKRTQT